MYVESAHLLVLAGGFGSRIRSVVSDVPKPLAPVEGQPFLRYLIESWRIQNIQSFTFSLHHMADKIVDFIQQEKNGLLAGCEVKWVIEPEALGTGGAVAYAVQQAAVPKEFLVVNADTWTGFTSLTALEKSPSPAMGITRVANVGRFGQVLTSYGKVSAFVEKSDSSGSGWINAGLYRLKSDFFSSWTGQNFSLEHDLFPKFVQENVLHAVPVDGVFIDIGIPEDYAIFNDWIRSGELRITNESLEDVRAHEN